MVKNRPKRPKFTTNVVTLTFLRAVALFRIDKVASPANISAKLPGYGTPLGGLMTGRNELAQSVPDSETTLNELTALPLARKLLKPPQ